MKTRLVLFVLACALTRTALAQSFSLDWFTIDGGGGTSTGGVYAVSGTIGQPDAGMPLTNGPYALTGGFWGAVFPVQQAGAPTLLVVNLQNGSVKVSWLPNTPGFVLQEAAALNPLPVAWTNAPGAYTNGASIPAAAQTRFFRLIKP